MTRRVAVVGGGLAGLAAAARLRTLGADPVVFERATSVGGVVRTLERDGWIIDTGPAMAAEPAPPVRALLDTAGLAECTVRAGPAGGTRYIVLDGSPVLLPRTTSEFSSSSLLSISGRLRLLKERLIPARRDTTDESVDSFARRRFGDEMAERMFDPLIASTCAGDPREIVARYAFPNVVGHERGAGSSLQGSARARIEARRRSRGTAPGSWSCQRGMEQLPQKLAQWIGSVRTNSAMQSVSATAHGFTVTSPHTGTEQFDAVVFAMPAPAFRDVAIDVPGSAQLDAIAAMPHGSIASVSLGFRRDHVTHPLDCSRLLVPSIERRTLLSMVFPSSVFAGRAPEGHVLMTGFVGGALHPEVVDRSDAELVALVQREAELLLGSRGAPAVSHVTRWRHALPHAVAGHGQRLAVADAIESANAGVAFAGAWRDGLAIGEVLLGGIHAAERIAARCRWESA